MKRTIFTFGLLAVLLLAGRAQATLIDRGGGLIYDTVLDITWAQDANLCLTLGNCISNRTDGRMTWPDANQWAANLVFRGVDNWRLPILEPFEGVCTPCPVNEYQHMYVENLNATAALEDKTGNQVGDGGVTLTNIQLFGYWSSTEHEGVPDRAGVFAFEFGSSTDDPKHFVHSAWAVRDGDVLAPVPEPATLFLFGTTAAGLGLARWRQRRRKQQAASIG